MSPEILSSAENGRLEFAEVLIKANCVNLSFGDLHTLSSGIQSPIKLEYERLVKSPEHSERIISGFEHLIRQTFGDYRFFCGVITGGALIAEKLGERFGIKVITRLGKKQDEERMGMVFGTIDKHSKCIIIEDFSTTFENAKIVVQQVRKEGGLPLGVVSILDYGFPAAHRRLRWDYGLHLWSLTKFKHLIIAGQKMGEFKEDTVAKLKDWWEKTSQYLSGEPQLATI